MGLLQNIVRVGASIGWTGVVGVPLLAMLYGRYLFVLLARAFGRRDVADEWIERNALAAGRIAQRYWAPVILRLARIRVARVEKAPIEWARSHVICANHASLFDILALVQVLPPPFRFVAKRELVKWPIFGWALRPAGQIVIDRADRSAAIAEIERTAGHGVRGQVVFFVEGTRSRDGTLRPFKKGAFHFAMAHGLPILPAAICGSHGVLGRVPWWRLRPGRDIHVVFDAAIEPSPASAVDPSAQIDALIAATRERIAVELEGRSVDGVDAAVETTEVDGPVGADRRRRDDR